MKTLTLLITIATLTFSLPSYAEKKEAESSNIAYVNVNGLVCDFCARALEKVFGKEDTVKNIDVNLDTKIITINFKDDNKIDDEKITKLITDSGYSVEAINHAE